MDENKDTFDLNNWLERNITTALQENTLPSAFCVTEKCEQIFEILSSGKNPIICGDSGIGKTAIIYEFFNLYYNRKDIDIFGNRQILQLSIRQRTSGLNKPNEQIGPEMQLLAADLIAKKGKVLPFFKDIHLAYTFDIETHFIMLAFQFQGPIIAEGDIYQVNEMFEENPDLEQHYVIINVDEPSIPKTAQILRHWSEYQVASGQKGYSEDALDEALLLTHRFLVRDHLPRKAIDLLTQTASLHKGRDSVSSQEIIERFCNYHRVPRYLIDPEIKLNMNEVEAFFSSQILGQDEALTIIYQMIMLIKAGLSDMRRPFGVFMFVGPTGVGKTHIAQCLAEYLFGTKERIIRINMADYPNEHDAKQLFGNPDAYAPQQKKGTLTQKISGNPFAVLLLDEFEKANPHIHDRLLQLFDEGAFVNGLGEKISCRSMIVIATSNEGAEIYRGHSIGFNPTANVKIMDAEIDKRLQKKFRFEFLNRFDRIVHFHPLSRDSIRTIALTEVSKLEERVGMKQRNLSLQIDDSILDWLAVNGFDPDNGARFLRRTIERNVTIALAEYLVNNECPPQTTLGLSIRKNKITALPVPDEDTQQGNVIEENLSEEEIKAKLKFDIELLLEDAMHRLTILEEEKGELAEILATMNNPKFWQYEERKDDVLERYRTLDVSIRMEDRLASSIQKLDEYFAETSGEITNIQKFRTLYDKAHEAFIDWNERIENSSMNAIWLMIHRYHGNESYQTTTQWLEQITAMEIHWASKMNQCAGIEAFTMTEGEVDSIILSVEGVGAHYHFAMEEGLHIFTHDENKDCAVVEVIPQSNYDSYTEGKYSIESIKKMSGPKEFEALFRIPLNHEGRKNYLFGADNSKTLHVLHDIQKYFSTHGKEQSFCRTYNHSFSEDLRTSTRVNNVKSVLKGKLNVFFEGWKKQHPPTVK